MLVDSFKLPLSFDPALMLKDLELLEQDRVWLTHPDYTVAKAGDWTAIAMASTDGDHTGADSLRYNGGAVARPTRLLEQSPYLMSVFRAFKTDVHRARLMNLKPGTRIAEHRDYGAQRYSVDRGYIRVHIPIRTHPDVAWKLRGKKVEMQPGEAWYTNVCEPHSVENLSAVNRVHLVLDMRVNDWVLGLLPQMTVIERVQAAMLRTFEPPYQIAKLKVTEASGKVRTTLGDIGLRELKRRLVG